MRALFIVSILAIAVGCSSSHPDRERSACAADFADCHEDSDCCAASYCGGPYGPTSCTPKSPDGTFCVDARECLTGTCVESVCGGRPATCIAAGAPCASGSASCCDGTECLADATGTTTCQRPMVAVQPPELVYGPAIAATECMGEWDYDCGTSGRPCCEGLYCEPEGSYYGGHCLPLVADGEWCLAGYRRCASGRCEDSLCRAATCSAIGAECASGTHAECCTGFCDLGITYAPPVCRERQPAGATCFDNAACISGSCNEGRVCD